MSQQTVKPKPVKQDNVIVALRIAEACPHLHRMSVNVKHGKIDISTPEKLPAKSS